MTETSKKIDKKPSEKRKRQRVLRCRVLPSEFETINKRADQLDVSISSLLRDSALAKPVRRLRKRLPSIARQDLARLTGELGKTGSELNRIFAMAERQESLEDIPALAHTLREFRSVLTSLTRLLR